MRKRGQIHALAIALITGCALTLLSDRSQAQKPQKSVSKKSSPNRLSSQLALTYSDGLDQNARSLISLASDTNLMLTERFYARGVLAFQNRFTKFEDKKQNYTFSDLRLSLGDARLYQYEDFRIEPEIGIDLPTSQTSQNASLRAAYFASLNFHQRMGKRFLLTLTTTGTLYDFEYDTADAKGTVFNEKWGWENSLDPRIYFSERLSLLSSAMIYTSGNYAGNTVSVYRFLSGPSYRFTKQMSLHAYLKTQDRVITTNPLFEDESTSLNLSLKVLL